MTQVTGIVQSAASVKYQILATIVANICCLAQGCAVGWTSPSLPLLLSAESPLPGGPVSPETAAWIGAILPVGACTGTFIFGLLSNYIGSKRSLILCSTPLIIHWIIVRLATEAWLLIVARFLSGLCGGGVFICISLFVAEISSERIRGQLSSLLQLSFNSGIVFGYIAGAYLDYYTLPLVLIVLPIVFLSIFVWLPNSPQYLLKQNQAENAEESLRYYRNIKRGAGSRDEAQLQKELEKLVLIAQHNADQPPVRVADFLTREALRGMMIGPTLLAVAQFSGTFTLSNYAKTIFRESGSDMDPNMSSVIMGSIQVVGTICASTLIDRLGRKMLLLISCAGSAAALFVTATYAYLNSSTEYDMSAWNVLPVLSLSFFIFIAAVGLTPVPYVLVSEVLPQKIRRIGATICVCTVSVYAFVMLRYFPLMLATFQLHGCMWFFSCVSVAGFVFTLFVVEETKGKNLDQLQPSAAEAKKRELA